MLLFSRNEHSIRNLIEQRVDVDAQASLVQEGGGPTQEDTVPLCRR